MANDKKTTGKKPGPKGPRKPPEERAQLLRAKLADLELRIKTKSDPEKAKIVRQIRQARKTGGDTPAARAFIKELEAKL